MHRFRKRLNMPTWMAAVMLSLLKAGNALGHDRTGNRLLCL